MSAEQSQYLSNDATSLNANVSPSIKQRINNHDTNDDNNDNESINPDPIPWCEKINLPQITLRSTIVGLFIGSIVLISNFQFGLQTGWVSMMSLPSALLGFAIFKLSPYANDFTDVENVFVQSIAVAVGTGPLAYGLIGIIPAIEKFLTEDESGTGSKINLSLNQLMIWSFGLSLFGVFFAIPLRKQVIIKEKLPFPSGSATATLISVLHGSTLYNEEEELKKQINSSDINDNEISDNNNCESNSLTGQSPDISNDSTQSSESSSLIPKSHYDLQKQMDIENYKSNIKSLVITFLISASYTLISYFLPFLKNLPIFGTFLSKNYQWNFQPSPAYIGQGIIMGLPTVSYMLFGTILGWMILAPLAKYIGWAPGEINDWINGGQGWILWLSLSVMISDSLISFFVVTTRSIINAYNSLNKANDLEYQMNDNDAYFDLNSIDKSSNNFKLKPHVDANENHLLSNKFTFTGIILSSLICVFSVRIVFGSIIPYYATIVAIFLALIFSVLGVRALGETDLNPVSGIGKLSQLVFALVIPSNHPAKILINIVAGGIAEAGAQQAGDLMQDLKTGHLIGASPKAQFIAQIIGTLYSVVLSSFMYKAYNSVYEIPSQMFRIPTAVIWIDCSRLVTGEGLPPRAFEFSIIFGIIFAIISLIKNLLPQSSRFYKYLIYLPNGVAVGIGIYNTPNFTLARFVGGVIAYVWINYYSTDVKKEKIKMIIISSGLVLGEGLLSGFTMLLTSLKVKHF